MRACDNATRAVAQKDDLICARLMEMMLRKVYQSFEDWDCSEVAATLAEAPVRRRPIVGRDRRPREIV